MSDERDSLNANILISTLQEVRDMEERIWTRLDSLEAKVEEHHAEISRYKGAIGTLLFLLSCLWAAFLAFKDKLLG